MPSHSRVKHVIVTGGAGFIGSHLVERLLRDGHSVTVLDDLSTGQLSNLSAVAPDPRLDLQWVKVSACPDLDTLIRDAGAIYHLAAVVGVDLVLRQTAASIGSNCRETEAVLEAAARHGVPIVLASSSEVYGRSAREVLHEDDALVMGPPTVGRWSYACSKLMGEFLALALARERGLPVTIARIFNTVGPRQTGRYGMVLPRFIEAAREGRPLPVHGDGRQTRCFCSVEDTVEALVRLHRSPAARGTVVNVGHDEPIEILELARLVGERCSSRSTIELIPYDQAYGTSFEDLPRRRPDLTRLRELTGFKPARGLGEIIDVILQGLTGPSRSPTRT